MTGEVFQGAALLALEASGRSGHRFTRLRYFERESKAAALEARLRADYPGGDIRVYTPRMTGSGRHSATRFPAQATSGERTISRLSGGSRRRTSSPGFIWRRRQLGPVAGRAGDPRPSLP